MQGKMMAYDRVVVDLNAARIRGTSFPVIHAFIQAALTLNPDVRAFLMLAGSFLIYALYLSERIRSYKYSIFLRKLLVNPLEPHHSPTRVHIY